MDEMAENSYKIKILALIIPIIPCFIKILHSNII